MYNVLMQLSLSEVSNQKYFWAFARDIHPPAKRYRPSTRPRSHQGRYVITSCSKQAKSYGVRPGMTYDQANKLVPGIRVIVSNR